VRPFGALFLLLAATGCGRSDPFAGLDAEPVRAVAAARAPFPAHAVPAILTSPEGAYRVINDDPAPGASKPFRPKMFDDYIRGTHHIDPPRKPMSPHEPLIGADLSYVFTETKVGEPREGYEVAFNAGMPFMQNTLSILAVSDEDEKERMIALQMGQRAAIEALFGGNGVLWPFVPYLGLGVMVGYTEVHDDAIFAFYSELGMDIHLVSTTWWSLRVGGNARAYLSTGSRDFILYGVTLSLSRRMDPG
jgi:hypothetical protein